MLPTNWSKPTAGASLAFANLSPHHAPIWVRPLRQLGSGHIHRSAETTLRIGPLGGNCRDHLVYSILSSCVPPSGSFLQHLQFVFLVSAPKSIDSPTFLVVYSSQI